MDSIAAGFDDWFNGLLQDMGKTVGDALTVDEASRILNVSTKTLYVWVRVGEVPSLRPTVGRYIIPVPMLRAYLISRQPINMDEFPDDEFPDEE